MWYDADPRGGPNPHFVLVGARADYLYVCLSSRPMPPSGYLQVDIDGLGDTLIFPQWDDYHFRIDHDETAEIFVGTDPAPASLPGFKAAHDQDDRRHQYEMRIPRSIIIHPDGVFGLHFLDRHELSDGFIAPFTWPERSGPVYELAVIDDVAPQPDSNDPEALVDWISHEARPTESDLVQIRGKGRDAEDVQTVEVWIDGVQERVCDALGASDREVLCATSPRRLPLGPDTTQVRVVDQVGRSDWSPLESFRVVIDGEPPKILVSHSPLEPGAGASFDITATATDPSGIDRIFVGSIPSSPSVCTFSGTGMTESCTTTVRTTSSTRIVRYSATAVDSEGFVGNSPTLLVLVGNDGTDTDGDGISDAHERAMCTSWNNIDSDGDALRDGWEVLGVPDETGTSRFMGLPQLGANPCHKDVFLQFDQEQGAGLEAGAFDEILRAYRWHGIDLHVEENERPRLGGQEHTIFGSRNFPYQRSATGEFWMPPERHWTHYYAWSGHSVGFSAGGERSITYNIYIGDSGTCAAGPNMGGKCGNDEACPESICVGVCRCPLTEEDPGSTCRGGTYNCRRESAGMQARRMLSELGHAVGLGHGGRDDTRRLSRDGEYIYYGAGGKQGHIQTNYKLNHMSVMNYGSYGGSMCRTPAGGWVTTIDYSSGLLGDLQEDRLSEAASVLTTVMPFAYDCSHAADPNSYPAAKYTCMDLGETGLGDDAGRRTLVVTDGRRTVARKPQNSDS